MQVFGELEEAGEQVFHISVSNLKPAVVAIRYNNATYCNAASNVNLDLNGPLYGTGKLIIKNLKSTI